MNRPFADVEAEHAPAIRERFADWPDDGEHVFVVTWRRTDGTTDLIVWRTLEGMVLCLARQAGLSPQLQAEAHYVCIREEQA